MEKIHRTLAEFFPGIDAEAEVLAERLELGDDDSVWEWFRHRYPDTMTKVARSGMRREFIGAVRELYAIDRGAIAWRPAT